MPSKKEKQLLGILILIGIGITLLFTIEGFQLTGKKQSAQLFLAFEMFLGVILLLIPNILTKLTRYQVPSTLKILYWAFIYLAVFIGTGFHYYGKIKIWDKFLHCWSAMLLVSLGMALIKVLVKKENLTKLSPIFVVLFGFFFAMTMGVFWEFYEFTFDGLLGMNMQRFATSKGVNFVGREALFDTMGDLFINCLGAIIYSIIAFIKLKKQPEWLEKISFQKIN